MKTLSAAHKRRMQEGRRKAAEAKRKSRPAEIAAIEAAMDQLGAEYRERKAVSDWEGMARVRADLRQLSDQRFDLRYGGES